MRWLADNRFQVAGNSPVRELRVPCDWEIMKMIYLVDLCLINIYTDYKKHRAFSSENSDDALISNFYEEEIHQAFCETILCILDNLSSCAELQCFPYQALETVTKLSPTHAEGIEFEIIRTVIPDFDREAEFDNLTIGETKDLIDTIKNLINSSRRLN